MGDTVGVCIAWNPLSPVVAVVCPVLVGLVGALWSLAADFVGHHRYSTITTVGSTVELAVGTRSILSTIVPQYYSTL
jgi:hypothetical protein